MAKPATILNNRQGGGINLRPYSLKELAALYGICSKTMIKWMKPFEHHIGERLGYFYNIKQVKKIFTYLDYPSVMYEDDINSE